MMHRALIAISLALSIAGCVSPRRTIAEGVVQPTVQGISALEIKAGSAKLILAKLPAGSFQMGSTSGDGKEGPVHAVIISHDFWMGKYTVTQAQFEAVMGRNPSNWKHPDNPVNQVTWDDAQAFVGKLNALQDRYMFRLPTEAEWEYACRAGTTGETYGDLNKIAWYGHAIFGSIHPVGQKAPNGFGLYDMLGNVSQWCQDMYAPYSPGGQGDPRGQRLESLGWFEANPIPVPSPIAECRSVNTIPRVICIGV
jgi:formylglycine-generating enzyme required for sulfatase activity